MLSRKRDELLLILNFSSPSLRLHGWICLRVSQTSKHSKVVTFSFSNELRGLGVRIRMELLSATQEQAGNSLDAKQIRVFRAGCPWYPLAKLVFRRSTIINFPKGQKNSYIVTSLLLWTLQDASFALLKFCRSCQTNNTICLPQLVLILKSQKQYCIIGTEPVSCSQRSRRYMFMFLPTISTKPKEPLKSGCPAAKLKLSDCVTWNTSHQILAQNTILSRPTCRNLKTMTPKQREVDQECLGVWPKIPTISGSPLVYVA